MLRKAQKFCSPKDFLDLFAWAFAPFFGVGLTVPSAEGVIEKQSKEGTWSLLTLIKNRFFIFQGFATTVNLIVYN